MPRDTTASFPSGIVETPDKHEILLMIEAEETQPKKSLEI